MVFYATVRRLNKALWDLNLMQPMVVILLIVVDLDTYMVGLDVGEMFNNSIISSLLEKYNGVEPGT